MSLNKVTLHGNVGQDPEFKTSQSGKSFCKFSIATSDGWGENKKTNWHNCTAFGKAAELISKYVKKGNEVVIGGSIDYNKHEEKIYTTILVNDFSFCKNGETTQSQPAPSAPPVDSFQEEETDLPF